MVATFGGRTQEELARYGMQSIAAGRTLLTDFNPNSVARTLIEVMALLAERLEEEAMAEVAEGIDRSSYRSFGFAQRLATQATGVILLSRTDTSQSQTIPAGSLVRVPATTRQYATTQAVTLDVGIASLTVGVIATLPGSFYNTPAATISEWIMQPGGATIVVSNPSAIVNGTDDETDEERRVRFGQFIASLPRATPFAVEYGARSATILDAQGNVVQQVMSVQIRDAYAITRAWIWDGQGTILTTTPSDAPVDEVGAGATTALVARTQQVIDGYRDPATGAPVPGYKAAGIVCEVRAATRRVQPVSALIYTETGYTLGDIIEAVRSAIRGVFARQGVGTPILRLNDLREAIGLTRGVIDHAILNPPADVAGGDGVIIVPGAIGLTQG